LGELTSKLEQLSLATNRVHLALELEDRSEHRRTVEFPVPVRDPKALLKHLQLDLEAHPPAAPIVALRVRVNPAQPRVLQNGLFVPAAPEPDKLQVVLARVTALVGEGHVGSPEILNTHRPDAFRLNFGDRLRWHQLDPQNQRRFGNCVACPPLRMAFRVFRPSLAATVRVAQIVQEYPQPERVTAEGVRGDVLTSAGPWRSAGEWWTESGWARDEWDISLSDGALYRLYLDLRSHGWFVEGMYD